ncbi:hypothetical protein AAFP94_14510 [Flavobacteriaceae bacterium MJ-SS4]|uniref:hypothetical protein n=1 Tax=Gilvirhabdus luticola TaxID=3079858 RepID=UPI0032DE1CCD
MIKSILIGVITLLVLKSYCQSNNTQESTFSKLNFYNSIETNKEFDTPKNIIDSTILDANSWAKWGFGADLSTGYSIFTEGLHGQFNNQLLFGVSFSMQYKKIMVINLGYFYGRSKTKKEIEIDNLIWKKNSKAHYHNLELSVAYPLLDNNSLRVLPFIGVSISGILAKDLSPNADYIFDFEKNEIEEKFNFYDEPILLGLSFDIKMNRDENDKKNVFGYLRVKYTFNLTHFDKDYNEFTGNIHTITFGFGGFLRKSRDIQ